MEVLTKEAAGDQSDCLMVIAIVGVGGIGKAALGQKRDNDEAIKCILAKTFCVSF